MLINIVLNFRISRSSLIRLGAGRIIPRIRRLFQLRHLVLQLINNPFSKPRVTESSIQSVRDNILNILPGRLTSMLRLRITNRIRLSRCVIHRLIRREHRVMLFPWVVWILRLFVVLGLLRSCEGVVSDPRAGDLLRRWGVVVLLWRAFSG